VNDDVDEATRDGMFSSWPIGADCLCYCRIPVSLCSMPVTTTCIALYYVLTMIRLDFGRPCWDRVISEPIICLAAEVLHTFDYVDSFCVSNVTSTGQSPQYQLHVLVTKKQPLRVPRGTYSLHNPVVDVDTPLASGTPSVIRAPLLFFRY
jgi:hypothetical protein